MCLAQGPQRSDAGEARTQGLSVSSKQGRRRVFKSGLAEEIIECRQHEWGRAREGDSPSC